MRPTTAPECFRRICRPEIASRTWMRTHHREIRYGELRDRAERMATLLTQCGASSGERVVIATRDDAEAALLFVSLIINGVTAVNIDPDTGPERAAALLKRARPCMVILDGELKDRWQVQAAQCEILEITAKAKPSTGFLDGFRKQAPASGLHALLAQTAPGKPPEHVPENTLAYILFTSGTTQQPKGVCISHRALFAHLETLSDVYAYGPQSVILNTLMLSHADGLIQGPVISFYNGITLHRPMRFEITELEALLDSVYQLRITHMVAVPTMLSLMTRLSDHESDAFRGGDFKLLISCGAALEHALWESTERLFGVTVINVYGLTETVVGGVFAGTTVGTKGHDQIGRPIDCALRIVDATGSDLPDGQPGELLMQGELLMSGYFDDETQTREVLREGWFHTGDIAIRSADGQYAICGRKKNIVIRGGYNIHPEEIVEVLNRAPQIRDAVAFGIPDPDWGEKLVALVEATDTDEQALVNLCKAALEPRKVPSRIVIVDALPRGRSGKVMLEEARSLLAHMTQTEASKTRRAHQASDAAHISERLLDIAARCFRIDRAQLQLSSAPRDIIGWDSLAHMDFIVEVETEFGIRFSPKEVMGLDRLDKAFARIQSDERHR